MQAALQSADETYELAKQEKLARVCACFELYQDVRYSAGRFTFHDTVPSFTPEGHLERGLYWLSLPEMEKLLGFNHHRRKLIRGFLNLTALLEKHGCAAVYLCGSFASNKPIPTDIDGCWDPAFVDRRQLFEEEWAFDRFGLKATRAELYNRYGCDFFPSDRCASRFGQVSMLEFFQVDNHARHIKGIIGIKLGVWTEFPAGKMPQTKQQPTSTPTK